LNSIKYRPEKEQQIFEITDNEEYDDAPYKGANKILRNEATAVRQSMPDLKKKKLEQRDFSDIAGLDRSLDVFGQGGVYSVMSPIDNLNQTKNS